MTYQRGPDDRHPTDYIDRGDTSAGWAPLILGLAFVGLLAFLMFGTTSGPPRGGSTISQQSELPNTAPSAPTVPTPAPPKPQ
jgi:hypothetical protein